MLSLSVVVMTYNESKNIRKCLESISKISNDTLVVDSYSTDDTVAIAKSLGARIIEKEFAGYIKQRAFCVEQAEHDFILALDADEWLSEELIIEIQNIKSEFTHDCYTLNRLSRVGKYWIKHGTWHPQHILRLFHKGKAICSGKLPHDKIIPIQNASVKKLKGKLLHQVNEDFADRIETINRHSTTAAQTLSEGGGSPSLFRIVFKPFYRFINGYLFHLGLLDGKAGFFVCITDAYYVFLREMKLFELKS